MTKTLTLLALSTALALPQLAAAQDITEFRIGVLGGENAQERMTNNECLRKQTEELLGVPVRLFTPADYDGVIQGLLGGTLDAAILGASGYAKAYLTDPEAVEPVLVKTNLDGATTYFSIGIARKDHDALLDYRAKAPGVRESLPTHEHFVPMIVAAGAAPAARGLTCHYVVLTADHGGRGRHHGDVTKAHNYTVPFVVWGVDAASGADLYDLNQDDYRDPGARRTTYRAAQQPIRNGEVANLALDLLENPRRFASAVT